ncbi:hypothetical protein [uncultured Sphingomonas sp.]|jgi:hypothetical protein|nr:hypothetical protein [uncultured Sphingomonas sp.]
MTRLLKSSFAWQFAGGFLIGTLGMGAVHVVDAHAKTAPAPAAIHATR